MAMIMIMIVIVIQIETLECDGQGTISSRPQFGQSDPDECDESLKPQLAGVWKTAIIR
jgi:hypothetical protein